MFQVWEEKCEPKNTTKSEEVCVEIPSQKAEKKCKTKAYMECNIVELPAEKIECDVIEAEIEPPEIPEIPAPEPYEICKSVAKPVEREVCTDVKMKGFTEKCSEVPVGVPSVDCGSQMMPLSLKNICVKIDFKLPRQECETETRQDCR